jgi:hypothetical protein
MNGPIYERKEPGQSNECRVRTPPAAVAYGAHPEREYSVTFELVLAGDDRSRS